VIFLTVGSQLPFDRLVRAVDEWAATRGKEVVGQVGASKLNPRRIAAVPNLDSQEFAKKMQEATAIVSHAYSLLLRDDSRTVIHDSTTLERFSYFHVNQRFSSQDSLSYEGWHIEQLISAFPHD